MKLKSKQRQEVIWNDISISLVGLLFLIEIDIAVFLRTLPAVVIFGGVKFCERTIIGIFPKYNDWKQWF